MTSPENQQVEEFAFGAAAATAAAEINSRIISVSTLGWHLPWRYFAEQRPCPA